jgi:predicted transcriptional regulator of viral defense system
MTRPDYPTLFRPSELERLGVSRHRLRGMVRRREVEQIARGLYRVTDAPLTEHETIAMVFVRIPKGVLCLLSALFFHDIGTQLPRKIWIAIDRKARKPRVTWPPVEVVRFSGALLHQGVETRLLQGVEVHVTSPARTVVDCFRYRNKIGLDVALEALKDVMRSRVTTIDEIDRAATECRMKTVMRPYLEILVA